MAERWQLWMPFHIDRFKGSPHVQAMRSAARSGYLYLLSAMWQTPDCTLPDDQEELQVLSGLIEDEWAQYGRTIMRRFTVDAGRVTNAVLRAEWLDAKRVFDARSASGRETSAKRSALGDRTVTERSPSRPADTRTLTLTGTETTQETSPTPPGGGVKKNTGRQRVARNQDLPTSAVNVVQDCAVGMYRSGEDGDAETTTGPGVAPGSDGTAETAESPVEPIVRDAGSADGDVRDGGTPGGASAAASSGAAGARTAEPAPASLNELHRRRAVERTGSGMTPVTSMLHTLVPGLRPDASSGSSSGVTAARCFLDLLHDEFARGFGMSAADAAKRPGWEDPLEAWQRCFDHVHVGGVEMDGDRTMVYLETGKPKDLADGLVRYKARVAIAMRSAFGHEVQLIPRDERMAA